MATATVTPIVPTKSKLLMDECQRLTHLRLPDALAEVLTQADDVLFKFANGADNSRRQNLFFDAMRELRLRRGEVEAAFRKNLRSGLLEALEPTKPAARAAKLGFEGELSLLGMDQVEEDLAINNFAANAKNRCARELFAIEQRLAVLLKQPKLSDDSNPLSPLSIGRALHGACQILSADIEARITLYKLFDRLATPVLLQFYAELNQALAAGGILPQLSNPAAVSQASRRTRVIIETDGERVEGAGDDVFSTLTQLMQTHAGHGGGGFAGGMGMGGMAMGGVGMGGAGGRSPTVVNLASGNGGGGSVGGFPAISSDQASAFLSVPALVDTLTQLQRGDMLLASSAAAGVSDGALLSQGQINVLRGLRSSGAIGQMAPTHDMTLEIVSLLFDYILQDKSIPDALKALLGRLQIPVLKVAILEREVFSHKSHPARRLLDTLARAAVGWYEGLRQSDALYAKMEQAIDRIVTEFEDDVGLFQEVLDDFNAFIEHETAHAEERAEKSSRSLRTREQIVLAKMAVDEELRVRLKGLEVREFVQNFLLDYWRQLLIITHVEHGVASDEWAEQMKAVDELVWSVQPKSSPQDRKELSARLPQMLKSVKRGMVALEMPPPECSKFLSMLASLHVVAIKNIEESSIAARKLSHAPERKAAAPVNNADINDPSSEEFVKRGLARIFERKVGEPIELDIDFSAFEPEQTIDEPIAARRDAVPDDAELERYVEQVTTLDLGDWMEFTESNGSVVRGRFTWISPTTGRYLFTNRQGDMMRDTTLIELAQQLKAKRAIIIHAEADPLFDRVLGELIDKLEAQTAAA